LSENIASLLSELHFPLVVKKLGIGSSMGKMVALVQTVEELEDFCVGITGPILLQDYYQIEYDTRVMVVGGKCLGGFDRFKLDSSDFITTRRGGSRDMTVLTPAQVAAAIEATRLQGLEIAGVDMFVINNQIYIIEVNCSPQFRVFERCTGINVAGEIISYLLQSKNN
jgi:ribosomal protein S6--L-glutamate ligase